MAQATTSSFSSSSSTSTSSSDSSTAATDASVSSSAATAAVEESKLQVAFAERTAMEMAQIVDWWRQKDRSSSSSSSDEEETIAGEAVAEARDLDSGVGTMGDDPREGEMEQECAICAVGHHGEQRIMTSNRDCNSSMKECLPGNTLVSLMDDEDDDEDEKDGEINICPAVLLPHHPGTDPSATSFPCFVSCSSSSASSSSTVSSLGCPLLEALPPIAGERYCFQIVHNDGSQTHNPNSCGIRHRLSKRRRTRRQVFAAVAATLFILMLAFWLVVSVIPAVRRKHQRQLHDQQGSATLLQYQREVVSVQLQTRTCVCTTATTRLTTATPSRL